MILEKQFTDENGEYIDPYSITVTITTQDGTVIVDEATPTRTNPGQYSYNFTGTTGTYTATWQINFEDEEFTLHEQIQVTTPIEDLITTFTAHQTSEDNTFRQQSYGETIILQLLKQQKTPLYISDDATGTMKLQKAETAKEFDLVIEDAEEGIVSYTWQENDLEDFTGRVLVTVTAVMDGKRLVSDNLLVLRVLK